MKRNPLLGRGVLQLLQVPEGCKALVHRVRDVHPPGSESPDQGPVDRVLVELEGKRHGSGRRARLSQALILRLLLPEIAFDLLRVGVVVGEGGVDLGEGEVAEVLGDLLRAET